MHDIDRVRLEIPSLGQEFEGEALQADQSEYEDKGPYGHGQLWGETENMELASELLEVSNEFDLDNFISALVGKATSLLNGLVSDQKKQALAGILKGAAKQILPGIASSFGVREPGSATAKAGRIFGLELEGLSPGFVRERGLVPSRDGQGLPSIRVEARDSLHQRYERTVHEVPSQLGVQREKRPARKIDDDDRVEKKDVELGIAAAGKGTDPGELPGHR